MRYTIDQIAARLGLTYQGDGSRVLDKVASLESADDSSLVFLEDREPQTLPAGTAAACVLTSRRLAALFANAIISENPKLDFARAAADLHPWPQSQGTHHPKAEIAPEAIIAPDVQIGPFAVVEGGARVGPGSIIHAGAFVGRDCRIGRECILNPGVVLYPGVRLGDRVILHAGVVLGGDGFGYVFDGRTHIKFPQVGGLIIEDDVEIGCNTTVDRGSLGTTRIGAGTKVDNLVQIAHNVVIGRNVVIAAQTGISGSTVIEDNAVIGGQVGFGDHARVQQGAVIGSKAGVLPGKIVRSGDVYWGIPVRPLREYKRLNALFGRLPEMKAEIDSLKKEIARLQEKLPK